MAKAYIGWPDVSDQIDPDTGITASTESSNFPVKNLLKLRVGDVYQNTSPSAFDIVMDFGAIRTFRAVILYGTNMGSTDTWRIRTANTEANLTAAPSQDTTALTFWGNVTNFTDSPETEPAHGRHIFSSDISNQWMRIDFATSGLTTFTAARLMVCSGHPFVNKNITYPSDFAGGVDRSRGATSARGRIDISRGHVALRQQFQAVVDTESEARRIARLYHHRGSSRDIVYIRDPDATEYESQGFIVGYLRNQFRLPHRGHNFWLLQNEITGA